METRVLPSVSVLAEIEYVVRSADNRSLALATLPSAIAKRAWPSRDEYVAQADASRTPVRAFAIWFSSLNRVRHRSAASARSWSATPVNELLTKRATRGIKRYSRSWSAWIQPYSRC